MREVEAVVVSWVAVVNVVVVHVVDGLPHGRAAAGEQPQELCHVRDEGKHLKAAVPTDVDRNHPKLVDAMERVRDGEDEYFDKRVGEHDDRLDPVEAVA